MSKKPSLAARKEQTIRDKLSHLRDQLTQFQEFKQILREDGIAPDDEDKRKESRLIQQILGFEKDLKRLHASAGPTVQGAEKRSQPFSRGSNKSPRKFSSEKDH